MLNFYFAPGTCALASHIALEDADADYELRRIDFAQEEQFDPGFLEINAKGRVPALVTERGILTETPAILAYVAQSYPGAQLAPMDDPFVFGQIQAFNSYLCSTLHVAHAHRMRSYRWVDEADTDAIAAMQRKVPESVSACYAYIETQAFSGPFVMGEQYTIADPYLFTVSQWLENDGADPTLFPKVMAHREMMAQRKTVQTALRAELDGTNP